MTQPSARRLPMTPKARWLIYLIEECLRSGDEETVKSLCKSMMQFLYNIRKSGKTILSPESERLLDSLLNLYKDEISRSPTT